MSHCSQLELEIQYVFREPSLLKLAMSHTSYANERFGKHHGQSNQRLEFLGDSVLGMVVSTYLYHHFPEMPEGKLSRLRASVVCESTLAEVALRLGVDTCLLLGNGEEQTGGRKKPSILADAMESLIAAIYLDSDFNMVSDVLLNRIGFSQVIEQASLQFEFVDYKTRLQELYSESCMRIVYEITDVVGPPHDCVYTARVCVFRNGEPVDNATGKGRSKKDAEQRAARMLLER
ncbi:MAG: ribonuclease III [Clostridia bacterium]|nr:ribonuclease III [Clostridia bacterium]